MAVCDYVVRRMWIWCLLVAGCSSDTLHGVAAEGSLSGEISVLESAPVTDTSRPGDGGGDNDVVTDQPSFMLWVEQPTIEKREGYFEDFYGGLADFINNNPADIHINKVLVRFLDAGNDSWEPAGNPWRPSLDSPLYTHLIDRLEREDVVVYAMPYLKVDRYPWTYLEGTEDIEQIVHLIAEWNEILVAAGSSHLIEGIAYDPEGAGIAKEDILRQTNQAKVVYGMEGLKVGMALPGKGIAEAFNWGREEGDLHLDEGYLQIYNLYTTEDAGSILVDSFNFNQEGGCELRPGLVPEPYCDDSIYLMARHSSDPATAIFDGNGDYTFKNILTQPQMNWQDWSLPAASAQYIYPMFSIEAIQDAGCIYPNTGTEVCGQINAFGTWEAESFKKFANIFLERMPELIEMNGQSLPRNNIGLFQYSFLPRAWVHGQQAD